jgi:hypothetical protein
MVTIFIERISNQKYDEHPVWQNILDIERYERGKDGFVTVFSISQLFIWHYLYKNLFSHTNRKDSAKGFKNFFLS